MLKDEDESPGSICSQCAEAKSRPSVGYGISYLPSKILCLSYNYFCIFYACKNWYVVSYIIILICCIYYMKSHLIYMHICVIGRSKERKEKEEEERKKRKRV